MTKALRKDIRFKKGNPGRRPDSRNKATVAVEALLDGEAEKLIRKAIEMALAGNTVAMRLCLDRLCPPRRTRPIELELPKVETAGGVLQAHAEVIDAMAQGGITPDEASSVSSVLEVKRRSIEACELEARITELENA